MFEDTIPKRNILEIKMDAQRRRGSTEWVREQGSNASRLSDFGVQEETLAFRK